MRPLTDAGAGVQRTSDVSCGFVADQRKDGHTVRVPNHARWEAFVADTARLDETPTRVLNQFMAWYTREPGSRLPNRPAKTD